MLRLGALTRLAPSLGGTWHERVQFILLLITGLPAVPHRFEVEVAEDHPKVFFRGLIGDGVRRVSDKLPLGDRELAAAEKRLVEALPGTGTAKKHLVVFVASKKFGRGADLASAAPPVFRQNLDHGLDQVFQHL